MEQDGRIWPIMFHNGSGWDWAFGWAGLGKAGLDRVGVDWRELAQADPCRSGVAWATLGCPGLSRVSKR